MTSGKPFVLLIWSSGLQNKEDRSWLLSTFSQKFLASDFIYLYSTHEKEKKNSGLVEKLRSSTAETRDGLVIRKYEHSVLEPTLTTEAKELLTWVHWLNSSLKLLGRPHTCSSPSCLSSVRMDWDPILLGTTHHRRTAHTVLTFLRRLDFRWTNASEFRKSSFENFSTGRLLLKLQFSSWILKP